MRSSEQELSSIIFNSLSDGLFLAPSTHDRAPVILVPREITMRSFPLKSMFDFEIYNYENALNRGVSQMQQSFNMFFITETTDSPLHSERLHSVFCYHLVTV